MCQSLTPESIADRLRSLDRGRQIAFGILMLERALPGVFQFQKESGWVGEGGRVRAALAQAWAALQSGDGDYLQFITEAVCDDALPDSEDFSSYYVSTAIDTVDLACNLLAFLEKGDVGLLAQAAMARQSTATRRSSDL